MRLDINKFDPFFTQRLSFSFHSYSYSYLPRLGFSLLWQLLYILSGAFFLPVSIFHCWQSEPLLLHSGLHRVSDAHGMHYFHLNKNHCLFVFKKLIDSSLFRGEFLMSKYDYELANESSLITDYDLFRVATPQGKQ